MIKNDKSVDSIINDQATNIWLRVLLPVISRSKGKKDMLTIQISMDHLLVLIFGSL